jgi:hypothetical protein
MHLARVDRGHDRYQGQMAVYVKPRGRLGKQHMAFIAPGQLVRGRGEKTKGTGVTFTAVAKVARCSRAKASCGPSGHRSRWF